MLRRAIELIRVVVVSPEMAIVMIGVAVRTFFPLWLDIIGNKLLTNEKLWEYVPLIPSGVLAFVVYLSFQMHAPVEETNRELYDWKLFWTLKSRILVSLTWALAAAAAGVVTMVFSSELQVTTLGQLLITALLVSITVAATDIMAFFILKEIMTK